VRTSLPVEAQAAIECDAAVFLSRPSESPLIATASHRAIGQQAAPALALSAERARAAPATSLLSWTGAPGLLWRHEEMEDHMT
jgi:hypothetical protein